MGKRKGKAMTDGSNGNTAVLEQVDETEVDDEIEVDETPKLDLALLISDDLSGKVLNAAQETRKWAIALADHFGQLIRTGTETGKSLGYPVHLSIEVSSKVLPGKKITELGQISAWLDEHVTLGSDRYRWAVVSNGTTQDVIVKIVRKREKHESE